MRFTILYYYCLPNHITQFFQQVSLELFLQVIHFYLFVIFKNLMLFYFHYRSPCKIINIINFQEKYFQTDYQFNLINFYCCQFHLYNLISLVFGTKVVINLIKWLSLEPQSSSKLMDPHPQPIKNVMQSFNQQ